MGDLRSPSPTTAALVVRVAMMQIRAVLVLVLDRPVTVHVAVLGRHGRVMHMVVVAVIVSMRVLVLDRLVPMAMGVRLGDVQVDSHAE